MKAGLIGMPNVGKTTLFNIMTGQDLEVTPFSSGSTEPHLAQVQVRDPRVDWLNDFYKPKKKVTAVIDMVDIVGLSPGASSGAGQGNKFLTHVRAMEAMIHVIRMFDNPDVLHEKDGIDPLRDLKIIQDELLLADLQVIESRLERIKTKGKVKKESQLELDTLIQCQEQLEAEKPLYELGLTDEQEFLMRSFAFLTLKPFILVLNCDEETYQDESLFKEIDAHCKENGILYVKVNAAMEMEIASLSEEERQPFFEEMGIDEPACNLVVRKIYEMFQLQSFFTVGEDEVRAWTIKKNDNAVEAAGKIHSDLKRGFIRAEVFNYEDLRKLGSEQNVKKNGLWALQGKDYIVKDGDILNIRFNV